MQLVPPQQSTFQPDHQRTPISLKLVNPFSDPCMNGQNHKCVPNFAQGQVHHHSLVCGRNNSEALKNQRLNSKGRASLSSTPRSQCVWVPSAMPSDEFLNTPSPARLCADLLALLQYHPGRVNTLPSMGLSNAQCHDSSPREPVAFLDFRDSNGKQPPPCGASVSPGLYI